MGEHLNTFQCLINQTISLEIPLGDEVLALLLLGSLPNNRETLMVILGNSTPQGKQLTQDNHKGTSMKGQRVEL